MTRPSHRTRLRLAAGLVALVSLTACGSTVQVGDDDLASSTFLPPGAAGFDENGVAIDANGDPILDASGDPLVAGSGSLPGASSGTGSSSSPTATSGPGTTSSPTGTAAAAAGGPTGTAQGVTEDTITIGIMTAQGFGDFAASAGFNAATGNQQAQAKKYIEYLNANGGIAGRKVVPVFHDLNIAGLASNPSSEYQSACSTFTEDNEVYAVATPIGTVGDALYQCLKTAGVPAASAGESVDASYFEKFADTFYVPSDMNLTRVLSENVDALHAAGWFGKDPVIGVVQVDIETEDRAVADGLVPALASHGLEVAETFAAAPGTSGTNQYGNAVLQFRSAGVTHVMFSYLGSALLFGQNAANQGYYPKFGLHSRQSPGSLLQGSLSARTLTGAMGIGWQQYNDVDGTRDPGPTERAQLCLSLMKEIGEDMSSRVTALTALWQCDLLFFLDAAIENAPDFSLAGFRQGAEALSKLPAASTFSSGLRAGQPHDGARAYRMNVFDSACACFTYTSTLRAVG